MTDVKRLAITGVVLACHVCELGHELRRDVNALEVCDEAHRRPVETDVVEGTPIGETSETRKDASKEEPFRTQSLDLSDRARNVHADIDEGGSEEPLEVDGRIVDHCRSYLLRREDRRPHLERAPEPALTTMDVVRRHEDPVPTIERLVGRRLNAERNRLRLIPEVPELNARVFEEFDRAGDERLTGEESLRGTVGPVTDRLGEHEGRSTTPRFRDTGLHDRAPDPATRCAGSMIRPPTSKKS